jgi:hypothetical protein
LPARREDIDVDRIFQEDELVWDVRRDDHDVTGFHDVLSPLRVHFSAAFGNPRDSFVDVTGAPVNLWSSATAGSSLQTPSKIRYSFWLLADTAASHMIVAAKDVQANRDPRGCLRLMLSGTKQ